MRRRTATEIKQDSRAILQRSLKAIERSNELIAQCRESRREMTALFKAIDKNLRNRHR